MITLAIQPSLSITYYMYVSIAMTIDSHEFIAISKTIQRHPKQEIILYTNRFVKNTKQINKYF